MVLHINLFYTGPLPFKTCTEEEEEEKERKERNSLPLIE